MQASCYQLNLHLSGSNPSTTAKLFNNMSDMDRLSEDDYKQRNESYIQKLRDERDEKLKKRYEELKRIKLEKKEDK